MQKFILILSFFIVTNVFSQQIDKPVRIDFKFGLPGLFGINTELITPAFQHKLSLYASYHGFNSNYHHDDIDERVRYFDGGVNYYFKDNGNGLYASLGYGHMFIDATIAEVIDTNNDLFLNVYGDFKVSTLNAKIGFKTRGTIFLRGEAGYGLGNVPKTVHVKGSLNNNVQETTIERPYYPGMSDSGYVLSTIGIGIAF